MDQPKQPTPHEAMQAMQAAHLVCNKLTAVLRANSRMGPEILLGGVIETLAYIGAEMVQLVRPLKPGETEDARMNLAELNRLGERAARAVGKAVFEWMQSEGANVTPVDMIGKRVGDN